MTALSRRPGDRRPDNAQRAVQRIEHQIAGLFSIFLSGERINIDNAATGGRLGQGWDFQAISVWIKNYCQAHPLDLVARSFIMLTAELEQEGH